MMARLWSRFGAFCAGLPVLLALAGGASGDGRVLSPPIRQVQLIVDSRVESPPVPNGGPFATRPRQGERLAFQVYVPEAVGLSAFGYVLEFDNTDHVFSDYFGVQSAQTWLVKLVRDNPSAPVRALLEARDMPTLVGSDAPGCAGLFVDRPGVSPNGLVATFTLLAKQDVPPDLPLNVTVSATVLSRTSPERLWCFRAKQAIRWL